MGIASMMRYSTLFIAVIITLSIAPSILNFLTGYMKASSDGTIFENKTVEKTSFDVPMASAGVQDLAGVLTPNEVDEVETFAKTVHRTSIIEIGVLIVNDTAGQSMLDYTTAVFEKNKIGDEQKDTGLLMVISKNDKKYFIETGYGLEGCLPDGKVGKIARENMIYPILDDYSGGSTGGGGVENEMKASGYGRAITDTLSELVKQCNSPEYLRTMTASAPAKNTPAPAPKCDPNDAQCTLSNTMALVAQLIPLMIATGVLVMVVAMMGVPRY